MAVSKTRAEKREYMNKWREANKDRIKAYSEEWKASNKEHIKSYQKEYHIEYRKRDDIQQWFFEKNLRRNYGITESDFLEMWDNQDGKCLICEINLVPRGRKMDSAVVDHNHLTDEVRGLLCKGCNSGIGHFKDNPKILASAIDYLNEMGNYSYKNKKDL